MNLIIVNVKKVGMEDIVIKVSEVGWGVSFFYVCFLVLRLKDNL